MNVTVLGAGAWGTALAVHAAAAHPTRLWARDAEQAAQAALDAPQRALPAGGRAAAGAAGRRRPRRGAAPRRRRHRRHRDADGRARAEMLARLPRRARRGRALAVQGLPGADRRARPRDRALGVAPTRVGVLSGPSFAIEVARGQPTALVAASATPASRAAAVAALPPRRPAHLHVGRPDRRRGRRRGQERARDRHRHRRRHGPRPQRARRARHARSGRDDAPRRRARRATAETFMGLSGLGDLVLTATGDLSRNRTVGVELAGGKALARHPRRPRPCRRRRAQRADGAARAPRASGVEMPIVAAVADVLDGRDRARATRSSS